MRLAAHSTTSPTPTAMGQTFIMILYNTRRITTDYNYNFFPIDCLQLSTHVTVFGTLTTVFFNIKSNVTN
jgi:hypothetical protein